MLNYSRTHRSVVKWGSREVSTGTQHSTYHSIYQAFTIYLVRCEVDFWVLPSHLVSTMQRYKKERSLGRFPRYLTVFRGKTGKKSRVTGKKTGKKWIKPNIKPFIKNNLYLCNMINEITMTDTDELSSFSLTRPTVEHLLHHVPSAHHRMGRLLHTRDELRHPLSLHQGIKALLHGRPRPRLAT